MSLNDFEYVTVPEELEFPVNSEEGSRHTFEVNIANTILKRQEALDAIDSLLDSAGEAWFDLGERLERRRTLNILDEFEAKLVESEEDAKMVIHVIREMVLHASREDREDGSEKG